MAFTDLPPEIISVIAGYSDEADVRSLCLASRGSMELLQQKAYRNLHLREDEKSGRAARALASGPRRGLVHHLHYSPREPRPVEDEGHDASIKLSDETRTMLQTLRSFPNLESFRLDLQHWYLKDYPEYAMYFSEYAGPAAEDKEPWRMLLNDSFFALCSSQGAFSTLEIYDLLPIADHPAYSALQTDEWRALLGGIKKLDIQLAEVPGEGASNMTCNHQDFLVRLESNFIGHLPNVEHVRLAGRKDGIIGHYHSDEKEPVTWKSIEMPKIRVFELEWSRIDEEAAMFVAANMGTLERVHFRECFATKREDWQKMFRNIANSNPRSLVEFEMAPAEPENCYVLDYESENGDEADGGGISAQNGKVSHGNAMSIKDIRHLRFVPVEVDESYGELQMVDDDWVEEDDIGETEVLEALLRVLALADRNRRAGGLS